MSSKYDEPEETWGHADHAAQFMPFAALTGYYDLVRRETDLSAARFDELGEELWPEEPWPPEDQGSDQDLNEPTGEDGGCYAW